MGMIVYLLVVAAMLAGMYKIFEKAGKYIQLV